MAQLKTSKVTKKSWVQDSKGNALTPKFKAHTSLIQRYENYVYIPFSSIGVIIFNDNKDEIILMENNTEILIGNFMMITKRLFVAHVKRKSESTKYWLYNEKGEFLGVVEGIYAWYRLAEFAYDTGIPVVKDGKEYCINYLGEVC